MMAVSGQKDFMRGLHNFITAVHHAKSKEEELKVVNREMAKIRSYYKEEKVPDWYQRRKYCSKLLYMYILGYDLEFGHMPAIQLLSAPKFALSLHNHSHSQWFLSHRYHEKHAGYLAVQLLLGENHEMMPLIVNSMQEDLASRTEAVQCLALSTIANIGGKELTETLAPIVIKILLASASTPLVKKKAAMAYLRLYRKNKGIFTLDSALPEKLVGLLDDRDLGVLNSVLTLIVDVATNEPRGFDGATTKAIRILGRVTNREFGKDYVYHNVPHPWLQIRCLRFLRIVPPTDPTSLDKLTDVLSKVLAVDSSKASSDNNKNAQNAILFEAIDLIVHLGYSQTLIQSAVAQLSKFVMAKEANLRYLALESLALLAETDNAALIRKHQKTVMDALKEVDISVRRRALDLLYRMCDADSSRDIIEELLDYLNTADVSIKDELVLKIAILAERFLTGTKLYVDVMLQLVQRGGDYVSDEIWFRVIKVVVNKEEIQEYAAKAVLKALRTEPWHETTVKIGGYILGEFGHLIAEAPNSSPADQFKALHARFGSVTPTTKALLLSTYAKFVNIFPDTLQTMRAVFESHRDNIDAEIQQRACEYLALTVPQASVSELMQTVLDAIPPWDEAKAASAREASEDARAAMEPPETQRTARESPSPLPSAASSSKASSTQSTQQQSILDLLTGGSGASGSAVASSSSSAMSSTPAQPVTPTSMPIPVAAAIAPALAPMPASTMTGSSTVSPATTVTSTTPTQQTAKLQPTPLSDAIRTRVKAAWLALCVANDGVLYQDDLLQVGVKSEYQGNQGRLVLFYGNLTNSPIVGFATSFASLPQLLVQPGVLSAALIGPRAQMQQPVHVTCTGEFSDIATVTITYTQHPRGTTTIELPLPVVLSSFVSPPQQRQVSAPDFVAQWKALSGAGQELQQVFRAKANPISVPALRTLFADGFRMAILERVDPKDTNLVLSGVLHAGPGRDVPVLVRLETNAEALMYRVTVRAGSPQATTTLASIIMSQIGSS